MNNLRVSCTHVNKKNIIRIALNFERNWDYTNTISAIIIRTKEQKSQVKTGWPFFKVRVLREQVTGSREHVIDCMIEGVNSREHVIDCMIEGVNSREHVLDCMIQGVNVWCYMAETNG